MGFSVDDNDAGSRLNAAAVWYSRLRSDAESDSAWTDFAAWLVADDANRIAFDQVEVLYADLDALAPDLDLIGRSKPAVLSNVVRLPPPRPRPSPVRLGLGGLVALAASLAVFIGIRLIHVDGTAVRYVTQTGETRTVVLADGTRIEMNTGSTLSVAFSARERRITLEKGEALFQVARDPTRPFLVAVAGRDVRDTGTVFNILHDRDRTVVTVESGSVSISPAGAPLSDRSVQLAAGDQLAVQEGAGEIVDHVDPAQATSWRDGYLTYKGAPLSVVVADLNRYFSGHIVLTDKDAGARRFSGVLKVDDEDAVLNRLAQLLPLVIDHHSDGGVGLRLKRQGD